MFWRRIATFIGTIRTDFMVELERNPLAVRQGAAAAVCIAAAAAAMPVIAHRAAEQRDGVDWSARQMAFSAQMRAQSVDGAFEPAARVELASLRAPDGLRARGSAFIVGDGMDRQALLVHAALRGPLAAPRVTAPTTGPEALDPRELRCLSEAIYYEARSESYRGQVAVGEVVMNRVGSRYYPNSVCSVVYQGRERVTGCQFTFTCDGSLRRRPRGRAWDRAQNISAQVMLGYTRAVTGRATHYHTTAVDPRWNSMLVRTGQIGEHVFYRFPNRTERAVLQAAIVQRAPSRDSGSADVNAAYSPPRPPVSLMPEAIAPQDIAPQTAPTTVAPADAPIPTAPRVEEENAPLEIAVPPPTDDSETATEVAA